VKIRELVWPHDRIAHISRHGVSPNEVEEVCFARSLVQEAKSTGENSVYGTKALRPVEKTMKTHDIPKTDSIEELARFWDAHDLTDFEDQLREVPGPIFERRPEGTVKVRLEPEEVEAVEKLAQARGVELGVLIHDWIVEKLDQALLAQRPRPAEHG